MHREIDEDIDAVLPDARGQLGIVQIGHLPPFVQEAFQAQGGDVGPGRQGVAIGADLPAIVVGQERHQKEGQHVLAKVRGDVADAQGTAGIGDIGMRLAFPAQRVAVDPVPAPGLPEDGGSVIAGVETGGVHKVRAGHGVGGIQFQRPSVAGHGLLDPAQILEEVAQVAVPHLELGPQLQGLA